jgi:predicted Holliday junction resolvase-like endonuclease
MNFNKFLKKNNILYLILIVLLIFGSLYFLTNNFKLIEGRKDIKKDVTSEKIKHDAKQVNKKTAKFEKVLSL